MNNLQDDTLRFQTIKFSKHFLTQNNNIKNILKSTFLEKLFQAFSVGKTGNITLQ